MAATAAQPQPTPSQAMARIEHSHRIEHMRQNLHKVTPAQGVLMTCHSVANMCVVCSGAHRKVPCLLLQSMMGPGLSAVVAAQSSFQLVMIATLKGKVKAKLRVCALSKTTLVPCVPTKVMAKYSPFARRTTPCAVNAKLCCQAQPRAS